MRVRLHPEARGELRDARKWYYERSPLSATAFAHAVDNAVSKIREAPDSFPLADHGTRKFVLRRFPFNIFYRPDWRTIDMALTFRRRTIRKQAKRASSLDALFS